MAVEGSQQSALVLFSGGQDSTVCLAWALDRFARVETIGFDYGQRHTIELRCRDAVLAQIGDVKPEWAARLGQSHLLNLDLLQQIGATALTQEIDIVETDGEVPNTFVPGRNLLFFTAAAALAYGRGIEHLVGGMCETDFSGYPDCRDETLRSLNASLNLGMDASFVIDTPLMRVNKAETFRIAHQLGGSTLLDLILEETHTCYLGDRSARHEWGYGCGTCPACQLRAAGWAEYVAAAVHTHEG